jgi:hypothetical protein
LFAVNHLLIWERTLFDSVQKSSKFFYKLWHHQILWVLMRRSV